MLVQLQTDRSGVDEVAKEKWVKRHLKIFKKLRLVLPAHVLVPSKVEIERHYQPYFNDNHYLLPAGLTFLDLKKLLPCFRGVLIYSADTKDAVYELKSLPTQNVVMNLNFKARLYNRKGRKDVAEIETYFQKQDQELSSLPSLEEILTLVLMLGGDTFAPPADYISSGYEVLCRNGINWVKNKRITELKALAKRRITRTIVYCRKCGDKHGKGVAACTWLIVGVIGWTENGQNSGGYIILPK